MVGAARHHRSVDCVAAPTTKSPFFGVTANQYTAKPQPNLSVAGHYRTDEGPVSISIASGENGGFTGKTLLLKLSVHKQTNGKLCQSFSREFQARTAQYDDVHIDGPNHANVSVPVHVFRPRRH
jgi:hypothetical protein